MTETKAGSQEAAEHVAHQKLVIFAWSGDLDRVWPTLILATSGAAMGMQTTVFFTFWGLFALVKPDVRITGENWMQKMMSLMNAGSAKKAKLSRYHFAGAGPAMFKKLANDHQVEKPEELIATAQELGVRLIPCQMTMDLLGLKREDLIDGLEQRRGLGEAAQVLADGSERVDGLGLRDGVELAALVVREQVGAEEDPWIALQ